MTATPTRSGTPPAAAGRRRGTPIAVVPEGPAVGTADGSDAEIAGTADADTADPRTADADTADPGIVIPGNTTDTEDN